MPTGRGPGCHPSPRCPGRKRNELSDFPCNYRNISRVPYHQRTYITKLALDTAESEASSWPSSLPRQTALQESVHERHWELRRQIILALERGYGTWTKRAATNLAMCSNGASFFIDPSVGKVKPWVSRCHHRMCLYCGSARSSKVAEQIHLVTQQMESPRLVVLTVKSVDVPLRDQLAHLRNSFRRLRQRKLWKQLVTGGIYTIEVTRNQKTGLWHPHLNAIISGEYFPQPLLRKLWHAVTGSADIVWISKVRDRQGAAYELAKYIGKPQHVNTWPDTAIRNYAFAVNGERLVQTFGQAFGIKVADKDFEDTEAPDTYQIKISRLVHLARRGAPTPQKLLVLIADRWCQFRQYIYHQIPTLEKPKSPGDQMRRLRRLIEGRAPPSTPARGNPQDTGKLDEAVFIAFCRFRADDLEGLYHELDYQHEEPTPWTHATTHN